MRPIPYALAAAALALAPAVAGCSGAGSVGGAPSSGSGRPGTSSAPPPTGAGSAPLAAAPALRVEVVARGLEHPWGIGFLPDGSALVTERPGRVVRLSTTRPGATVTPVRAPLGDVLARGEGGLLGLVVHPDFATTRLFTTCQNHGEGGRPTDIRLVTWRLAPDGRSAERVKELLTGLPTAPGGRHSGCRPLVAPDGALLVGTGDTAQASVSQDRKSLGGKVIRLDLRTGAPLPDNPFASSSDPHERYVWTYGHRNVQGLAARPGTGEVWSAEHGPSFDDEVNLLRRGGNYGWDPSRGGASAAYDESVPMTDLSRFPEAVSAVWTSGETTQAICDLTFLSGRQWGALDGALVTTALKGSKALVLTLTPDARLAKVLVPRELDGPFGRLRAARQGPDGALYVTSSNGGDDVVLRVTLGR